MSLFGPQGLVRLYIVGGIETCATVEMWRFMATQRQRVSRNVIFRGKYRCRIDILLRVTGENNGRRDEAM